MVDVAAWLALPPEQRKTKLQDLTQLPAELEAFFGCEKKSATGGRTEAEGRASRVLFDDGEVAGVLAVQGIDHISIDRFTGGVRAGYLFVEEVLVGGSIVAKMTILPPLDNDGKHVGAWGDGVRKAFCHALRDLCAGHLAVGAKSLGFCCGDVIWTGADAAPWEKTWNETKPAALAAGLPGAAA
jgi:hypothetical protein